MRIVVQEWERVLVYEDGRFQETLGPGRHRRPRRRRLNVRVGVRPRLIVVPAQEVLTADGLSVKVSLSLAVRTADPRRWFEAVENADSFVYSAVQIALRDEVSGRSLEELLAVRGPLAEAVRATVAPAAEAVGVALESVALRDLMVPAELRRAAAEVATARAQGQAAGGATVVLTTAPGQETAARL